MSASTLSRRKTFAIGATLDDGASKSPVRTPGDPRGEMKYENAGGCSNGYLEKDASVKKTGVVTGLCATPGPSLEKDTELKAGRYRCVILRTVVTRQTRPAPNSASLTECTVRRLGGGYPLPFPMGQASGRTVAPPPG